MIKFVSLFRVHKPKRKSLIRKLRRLAHQRKYWRNRSLEQLSRRPR